MMLMSDIYDLADLLQLIVAEGAEGLTLRTGKPPVVELRGISHTVEGPALSPENADILLRDLLARDECESSASAAVSSSYMPTGTRHSLRFKRG
jgi:hypothetical protein